MFERDHHFVRSREDAEIVQPLSKPDAGCASALGAAREQIFIDFLLERTAILCEENAKHGARRQKRGGHRERENSAAQALEARKGEGEFMTRTRRGLSRARSSVHVSWFRCRFGHRL